MPARKTNLFGHVKRPLVGRLRDPADRATDGAFRTLFDRAEEQVRDLIIGAARHQAAGRRPPAAPTSNASATCTRASWDEQAVAVLGVQPLLDELATIDDAADATGIWPPYLAPCSAPVPAAELGVYVDTDSKDSTRYLVHLSQSGLGLPDESYYRDEQHAEILAAYPQHIAAMFTLVYGGDHSETAARIVALEPSWPPHTGTSSSGRDARPDLQPAQVRRPVGRGPRFDWAGWVTALGASPGRSRNSLCASPIT